jgi:acyl dehydratase
MSITVGQRASRSLTLTAGHVRAFAEMSGDYNPLHFDEAFAKRTKFGRLVVQGGQRVTATRGAPAAQCHLTEYFVKAPPA